MLIDHSLKTVKIMGIVLDSFKEKAANANFRLLELPSESVDCEFCRLALKFTDTPAYTLWRVFVESTVIACADEQSVFDLLQCVLYDTPTMLLFEDEPNMFRGVILPNSSCVVALLHNNYGFEYYLFDTRITYAYCRNRHNDLIACGDAIGKLNTLKQEMGISGIFSRKGS